MAAIKDCWEGYGGPANWSLSRYGLSSSQRRAAPCERPHLFGRPYERPRPGFRPRQSGHSKPHLEELTECLAKSVSCLPLLESYLYRCGRRDTTSCRATNCICYRNADDPFVFCFGVLYQDQVACPNIFSALYGIATSKPILTARDWSWPLLNE